MSKSVDPEVKVLRAITNLFDALWELPAAARERCITYLGSKTTEEMRKIDTAARIPNETSDDYQDAVQ